jgi:hypothetical protein
LPAPRDDEARDVFIARLSRAYADLLAIHLRGGP